MGAASNRLDEEIGMHEGIKRKQKPRRKERMTTTPPDKTLRDAMMKGLGRVAARIAGGSTKKYKFIYGVLMEEVTKDCRVLGDPNYKYLMTPAMEDLKNPAYYRGAQAGLWPDPVEPEGALKSTKKARKIVDKL